MKVLAVGKYSHAGLSGFVDKPDDDRKAVVTAMVEKAGGKLIEMLFLRGKYDFAVIIDVPNFDAAIAIKLLVLKSGAIDVLELMETIDLNKIAKATGEMAGAYRAPGA